MLLQSVLHYNYTYDMKHSF